MASRSISRKTSMGYSSAYSSGLSKSYGSGLSSNYGMGTGYSFSSGYSSGYSFSSYIARTSSGFSTASPSTNPRKKASESVHRYGASKVSSETKLRSKSVDASLYGTRETSKSTESARGREMSLSSMARPQSEIRDITGVSKTRQNSTSRDVFREASRTREVSVSNDFYREPSKAREISVMRDVHIETLNKRKSSVFKDGYCEAPNINEVTTNRASYHEPSVPRDFSRSSSVIPDLELPNESFTKSNISPPTIPIQLNRSNSFHQLRDSSATSNSAVDREPKYQAVRNSVSGYDLERAASWALIGPGSRNSRTSMDMGCTSKAPSRRDSLLVSGLLLKENLGV